MKIVQAKILPEGMGVEVKRLMPIIGNKHHDPFVMLDDFSIAAGSGFPEHPHRGFEAITYLFDGGMHHQDTLGNDSVVYAGGAQRFTAGSGMRHSEMPEGKASGIQLWINLPKRLKNIPAAYQATTAAELPEHVFEGGKVRVIVGEGSPVDLHTAVRYLDIHLDASAEFGNQAPTDWQGFVYVVFGEISANEQTLSAGSALFSDAANFSLKALAPSRVMLVVGKPHQETIILNGPYVD